MLGDRAVNPTINSAGVLEFFLHIRPGPLVTSTKLLHVFIEIDTGKIEIETEKNDIASSTTLTVGIFNETFEPVALWRDTDQQFVWRSPNL
jgi:hypothetical protein